MMLLAVDTATPSCSVAVTDGEKPLAELTSLRRQTHSRHLMGMIEAVLATAGIGIGAVDGFAVVQGPGSFTGLRIGVSTVKGLAMATGRPVAGVSSLAALAAAPMIQDGLVCAMIDARKGEVYSARYMRSGDRLTNVADEAVTDPAAAVAGVDGPCLFVGDGAALYRETILTALGDRSGVLFAPAAANVIHAATVARLAVPRFLSGATDHLAAFTPQYIRKSDAELHLGKTVAAADREKD